MSAGEDWSVEEVEATVADYFAMLQLELTGSDFNKAEQNRRLRASLRGCSKGAVEFKHANISAVLCDLNVSYITGLRNCHPVVNARIPYGAPVRRNQG